jgi:rare lipoprotein A
MVMKRYFWIITGLILCSFAAQNVIETGKASYYANKFEGRRTSSGEVFRQDSLTAAHKTLPFGTKVLVRNLKNDSTVILKINDRLSKSSAHCIDVSLRAAQKLNFVRSGITTVTLETINEEQ